MLGPAPGDHDLVEAPANAGFEDESRVHKDYGPGAAERLIVGVIMRYQIVSLVLRGKVLNASNDPRVHDGVELLQPLRVAEHDSAQARPVDLTRVVEDFLSKLS